jgi:predicted dehydrogenase
MKIGVVGLGKAATCFLSTLHRINSIKVEALCVRKPSLLLEDIVAKYTPKTVYFSYQEFLNDQSFDTVYIAVPNYLHYEFTKSALLCRKNVIVEKPMVPYISLGTELEQIARNLGLFLFEAMTTYYMPNYHRLEILLPKIGQISAIQCSFSKISCHYKDYCMGQMHPVFSREQFGGALYDMNCYQIALVSGLLDKPVCSDYYPHYGYQGVDISGVAVLQYKDFTAVCHAAKDSGGPNFFHIYGTKGYLRIDGSCNWLPHLSVMIGGKEKTYVECIPKQERMQYEFIEFCRLIQQRDYDTCYAQLRKTLCAIEIMEDMERTAYEFYYKNRLDFGGWQGKPHGTV